MEPELVHLQDTFHLKILHIYKGILDNSATFQLTAYFVWLTHCLYLLIFYTQMPRANQIASLPSNILLYWILESHIGSKMLYWMGGNFDVIYWPIRVHHMAPLSLQTDVNKSLVKKKNTSSVWSDWTNLGKDDLA